MVVFARSLEQGTSPSAIAPPIAAGEDRGQGVADLRIVELAAPLVEGQGAAFVIGSGGDGAGAGTPLRHLPVAGAAVELKGPRRATVALGVLAELEAGQGIALGATAFEVGPTGFGLTPSDQGRDDQRETEETSGGHRLGLGLHRPCQRRLGKETGNPSVATGPAG
jgi:hypothetical protein